MIGACLSWCPDVDASDMAVLMVSVTYDRGMQGTPDSSIRN
jgi:hypothetical protein